MNIRNCNHKLLLLIITLFLSGSFNNILFAKNNEYEIDDNKLIKTTDSFQIKKIYAVENDNGYFNNKDNREDTQIIKKISTITTANVKTSNKSDFNFVAVGDFYCNDETEDTIENIISVNPELIITTGDHVKDERSADCWIEMSQDIKDKMKIAIGNHDVDSSKIFKQITRNHNLTSPYYSHDFKNIHFISLSTEHPFEKDSKQYEFIKDDLEQTSKNPDIDWIIVHNHKAFYSTRNDKEDAEELRNTYHPLFEKYNVDLVISSHNQYYERTYPLLYNNDDDQYPIVIDNSESNYSNTDGIIFLTVGTGGDELQEIIDKEDYYIIQKERYGFLNLKLENNGKTMIGEFHTNKGKILDNFELTKS